MPQNSAPSSRPEGQPKDTFAVAPPAVQLPKGGGAIRGMGEKFAANPVTGTGSMSVPIATSPGRSGFGPQLSLSYDSGAGNGPFGFGWNLSLPAITRKTDKGLPRYFDNEESDVFILSGAEDLVPEFKKDAAGIWDLRNGKHVIHDEPRTVDGVTYQVRRYRPRIEGLFARIERWMNTGDATDVFWRSISKDNVTTWYGKTAESRIIDPADQTRIFSWLICQSYDDKGNAMAYEYRGEDSQHIFEDAEGKPVALAHEANRTDKTDKLRSANRYLKRIKYGNRTPNRDGATWQAFDPTQLQPTNWMFEVVFDYGEGHYAEELPDADQRIFATAPIDPPVDSHWPARQDRFSSYRAGFEIRTYRLCRRVLMFHHFPDELGTPDYLVRATEFTYAESPVASFITSVTQSGFKRQDNGSYLKRSLPPLEFEYSEVPAPAELAQQPIVEVDADSLENLPIGLDGANYQWIDLDGEGISGILTEQAGAWFYKRNLSPINEKTDNGKTRLEAQFSSTELLAARPNLGLAGGAQFMDLAGDGQPDLVVLDGPMPGYYEHDGDEGWQPFRLFTSRLNHELRDPNLKFVDLNGDGHADVLITEDDAFVWHVSLAEEGFGPASRVAQALDEESGPRLVFADGTQSIYLADLSGDGLTDLARIRSGEVCYWPNLGYGRFGAKVTMDNAPWFDYSDQFSQQRIRLADIDGSGTTDIIYLGGQEVSLYFNQSGNSWSEAHPIPFPAIDNLAAVQAVDLLGNGTACLVWSSPLPGSGRRSMRYLDLMGGQKPHLLVKTVNNLGAETRVNYVSSTKFYLRDKRDGKPWITRLPFPVHVVERVETFDRISRNRFVTRYAYHHGYFDGEEREFRGFGMVEQTDTEAFAALTASGDLPVGDNVDAHSHIPPLLTRTWFHTGVYVGRDHVTDFFAGLLDIHDRGEYYRGPACLDDDDEARERLLPDTILPSGLTLDEEREAARSLKGMMLRQEVYAQDGVGVTSDFPNGQPYTVAEQNFTVRPLQPRDGNRHAVFFTHPREAITYHYEREPQDPRIQHALTLEVDGYGNVLTAAAIGYGRRVAATDPALLPEDHKKQRLIHITVTENSYTNVIALPDAYRTPLPAEASTYELRRSQQDETRAGSFTRYPFHDMLRFVHQAGDGAHDIAYEDIAYERAIQAVAADAAEGQRYFRRLIERVRTLYRPDDCGVTRNDPLTLLALGVLESLALPGESYKLAFTPGLLDQVYERTGLKLLLPDAAAILGGAGPDRGGYVDLDSDDHWWIPSGRPYLSSNSRDDASTELAQARQHFFLPRRYCDPFGQDALVDFDAHDLLMAETRDALGNRVTVDVNDYCVLQPRLVSDPNRNRSEVAFDALGMVVGTAVMGKPTPAPVEGDKLTGFVADLAQTDLDAFFDAADPHAAAPGLLRDATTRIVYDLDRFRRTQQAHPEDSTRWQAACAATLARETHVSAPLPPPGLKIQLSFSYSDGFGREIQKKIQAEGGKVPQSDAEGKIIVGPDNQPVMTPNDVSPRWVGSGWTVFNNKGKPVRQYEPFFTDTHRFEFDVKIGVSPVLFYDPAERVVVTLHPNHTYEKVVFDPWQQTTHDVNDTCAPRNQETGDPRTDPDIWGYVAEYFKTQPAIWQTWHAQRIGGALGPHEQAAATRAADHADTPIVVHFDALSRPFLTIAHNRFLRETPAGAIQTIEEKYATRVELDIEGNQCAVRDADQQHGDPLGRIVMRYDYDMLGNRIHQLSMEAGARWMLNDVVGKPIRAWDSRGHNFTTTYDALRRPVEQRVRGTTPESDPRTLNSELLVDKIEYGEPPPNPTPAQDALAQSLNLRTRIYRHFDSAGVATNALLDANGSPVEAYDFKGNLLRSTRRLARNYTAVPDWSQPSEPQLDAETFVGSTRYDALNRPIQSVAPYSSLTRAGHPNKFNIIQPVFNEANLLERVDVWLERATEPSALLDPAAETPSPVGVANIDYDPKGQRLRIEYKNGATTHYRYDPDTFRLVHLYTRRSAAFTADCDNPAPPPSSIAAPEQPPAGVACGLQNLHYTYDPAGNITHIQDDAQQTIFFKNQIVEPSNDYTYDAVYRLIEATGREHLGQVGGAPIPHSHHDTGRVGLVSADAAGQFAPNDGNAMARYCETYTYDAVGNFLTMSHHDACPGATSWTRAYDYVETSLIEDGVGGAPLKTSNRLSSTTVGNGAPITERYVYDAHGNMTRMPHLGGAHPSPNMHWDYKDQLRQTDLDGGGTAYYVYDASGQRVRKVWEKAPGLVEERIYLGGFEIFRKHGGPIGANTATLARQTLHIMDDKQRIALVETRTLDAAGNDQAPRQQVRYQFGNHLGSASLEMDDQAQIISYEEYAPYGSTTYQAVRSQTETPKRYRYTGKERDEESGLYYHGARYYAPWLGRWTRWDPLYLKDSTNVYIYALDNPIVAKDPAGRLAWLIPVAVYLGYKALTSAGETAVEAGIAKATGDEKFSTKGTFLKNMIVNSTIGLIPGITEAKIGVKAAVYSSKLALRTTADATLDTLLGKGDFAESLIKSGAGNLGGDLFGAALKKGGSAIVKNLKGSVDEAAEGTLKKITQTVADESTFNNAVEAVEDTASVGKRWKVGDPHWATTAAGRNPTWNTARERYWKNRAASARPGEFTPEDMNRMRKRGYAPKDPHSGLPMELEHVIPQRTGASNVHQHLFEVTPLEHSFFDRYRHVADPAGRSFNTTILTDPRP